MRQPPAQAIFSLRPFLIFLLLLTTITVFSHITSLSAQETDRWESDMQKFEKADEANPPKSDGVMFLGSSSIRMWDVDRWFPELKAVNRGFGGSEISDSIRYFDRLVMPHRPKTIVFYAGDNDIAHDESPESVAADFKEFTAIVHRRLPKTRILYVAIKPSTARWSMIDKIRDANGRIKRQASKDPLVVFVDVEPPMLNEDGIPRAELMLKDGLHLNDAGYKIWTELVQKELTKKPKKQ